jgi:hypothetical protein
MRNVCSDIRRKGFFCQLEQYCGLAFLRETALHLHERGGDTICLALGTFGGNNNSVSEE